MVRHASQDGGRSRERSCGLHGFREEGDHHLVVVEETGALNSYSDYLQGGESVSFD